MHTCTKLGTHVLPVLVNTGATQNFLSYDAAEKLGLTWKENDMPEPVTNADGSKCGTGMITQYCDIPMKLNNLWKEEWFFFFFFFFFFFLRALYLDEYLF